ncbi:hypothetical protein [Actinoplanes awajinensis]|uniref:PE-PGRS family protein n=1 Tax=Actinoplanes awajinensis subsp. mycoplanecinus TaxID=135947 RepID=A0A0X3V7J8_9ACTN|nr:hypothetical protein [Actinoplanes awajinensis]KUL40771.1 hypothetical protein ADL15_05975 [Actinoplanes awajinensis subsp. mycoplanecinus]
MQTKHPRRALVASAALAAALLVGACGDSSGDKDTPADTGTSPSACAPGAMPPGMGAPGGGPSGTGPVGGGPSGTAPGGMGPSGGPGGGGPGGDCGGARPSGAGGGEGSGGGAGSETGEFDSELEPTGFIPRGTDLGGYGRRGPVGAHGDVLPAPGG